MNNPHQMKEIQQSATPSGSIKGFADWEQHSNGIGARLQIQNRNQSGEGLKKTLKSIAAPVIVRKYRSVDCNPKLLAVIEIRKFVMEHIKYPNDDDERYVLRRAGGHRSMFFRNITKDKVTKVDMTESEKRVFPGIGKAKMTENDVFESKADLKQFQLTQLMHNMNLLENHCVKDNVPKDQLKSLVQLKKDYLDTLEGSFELMKQLVNPDVGMTLEKAQKIFTKIKFNHPNEYKEYKLKNLAHSTIPSLVSEEVKDWNPLVDPTKHVNTIIKWADILDYSHTTPSSLFDPYPEIIWSSIIPVLIKSAVDWNPHSYQPMTALLDTWSSLLPEMMYGYVLDQSIIPKLKQAINEWDPLTDTTPIHIWILPWIDLLGFKFDDNVFKIICEKLSEALRAWHPEDRSALAMITPWKETFTKVNMLMFLHKNIVPKLELRMSEVIFNPLQQDLEVFNQVWEWNELISPLVMANILDTYFFPKWMQTLVMWLNQSPNFDEVSRWCSGWKGMMSESVLSQPNISEHFRRALELIQHSNILVSLSINNKS